MNPLCVAKTESILDATLARLVETRGISAESAAYLTNRLDMLQKQWKAGKNEASPKRSRQLRLLCFST
jgi:hypothetical protein